MTNAGYTIIKREFYNEKYCIVLGERKLYDGERYYGTNYVTWDCEPEKNHYFWGHYHTNYYDALRDYHLRLISYYNEKCTYYLNETI